MSNINRSFTEVFIDLENGSLEEDATIALADLTHAVLEHGKAGALTITLKVKPHADMDRNVHIISTNIKLTKPEASRKDTLMFSDDNCNLTREDPHQLTMDQYMPQRTTEKEAK